ncbi:MAG: replication initiation protein, partial [Cetobacterium sp.]
MKKFKDLILFKPNQLIEITGAPLTAQGLLTYDFILHRLQQEKTDNLILSLNEITAAIGIEGNYDEIYLYLDSLQRIRIESKDVKGKLWGAFNLLSEYKKCEDGVFVAVPPTISKALKTQDDNKDSLYYTTIKLLEKRVFRCVYSLIFYDLFKKYEKVNIPILGLDEIREFTGTINKYPEYKAFKV